MTNYFSTRDLGVTRDVFALPYSRKTVVPFSVSHAQAPAASLSPQEIGLIRSLIEDQRTILWLDHDHQVKTWDMDDGIKNQEGIILVL
jgi:hypothetical protein